ncbi:hypothetical protein OCS_01716 [Ophiocordyceps sinensis CO18]|uniref:Uncharacterized protein n=1 Tax=Ophiocordyceps sinensis (strain Co18 / CGMCC 3.14243) TaxID=911162 RepID=T5AL69_OPHSC|nr:hypothetical protein OCS_01716 [Ophiocordyceps sinensis CO18]
MGDLKSFSLVCKEIQGIVSRILWRTLVVRPRTYNRILLTVPSGIPSSMVRHLHFRAEDDSLQDPRCIHWDSCPLRTGLSKYKLEPITWPRFEELSENAVNIIGHFKRGQLWSFSRCERWPVQNSMLVERFRFLQDLCWIGPPDLATLAELLSPRAGRVGDPPNSPRQSCAMSSLELDWTTNDLYRRAKQRLQEGLDGYVWMDPRARASGLVGMAPSLNMPYLQYLCLTRVSLAVDSFSRFLHIQALQELTIRDCTGWTQAMAYAVDHKKPARFTLQMLEIMGSDYGWGISHAGSDEDQFKWLRFFDFIDDVEELYLCIEVTSVSAIRNFWEPFDKLGNMATKHVLHYRENSHQDWFEGPLDVRDMGTCDDQSRILHRPFSDSSAQSLGICCEAPFLRKILKPFAQTETLQFLHVRQTAQDLDERASWGIRRHPLPYIDGPDMSCFQILEMAFFYFAKWVFGPCGISSLEVLAFGDFGKGAVLDDHNFLLFRCNESKCGFRFVNVEEDEGADVISEHQRLLEACPTVPRQLSSGDLREFEQAGQVPSPFMTDEFQDLDGAEFRDLWSTDSESDDYDSEQDSDAFRDDGNESEHGEAAQDGDAQQANQDNVDLDGEGAQQGDNEPGHEKTSEGSNAPEGDESEESKAVKATQGIGEDE